ncbi:MAG: hypothetical protein Hyperionvirus19_30 [Hyperionvirus sp.]|uniref:Uncharacterized protein n=1 Tax=Hyperionvirus sp. TaxID=2487770 RepID=A0A3G5AAD1_9VIRU|nr:MAG: hypothetical protein Hyperionvirus19_30 [Hyperionvirus sp.]
MKQSIKQGHTSAMLGKIDSHVIEDGHKTQLYQNS